MCNQKEKYSGLPLLYTQRRIQSSPSPSMANLTSDKINKKKWSDEADAKLQDLFASTDWNMLWDSAHGIEEYSTSVTEFINKDVDDVIPTVTIRTYPKQRP